LEPPPPPPPGTEPAEDGAATPDEGEGPTPPPDDDGAALPCGCRQEMISLTLDLCPLFPVPRSPAEKDDVPPPDLLPRPDDEEGPPPPPPPPPHQYDEDVAATTIMMMCFSFACGRPKDPGVPSVPRVREEDKRWKGNQKRQRATISPLSLSLSLPAGSLLPKINFGAKPWPREEGGAEPPPFFFHLPRTTGTNEGREDLALTPGGFGTCVEREGRGVTPQKPPRCFIKDVG